MHAPHRMHHKEHMIYIFQCCTIQHSVLSIKAINKKNPSVVAAITTFLFLWWFVCVLVFAIILVLSSCMYYKAWNCHFPSTILNINGFFNQVECQFRRLNFRGKNQPRNMYELLRTPSVPNACQVSWRNSANQP